MLEKIHLQHSGNCLEQFGIDGFPLENPVNILRGGVDAPCEFALAHTPRFQFLSDEVPDVNCHAAMLTNIFRTPAIRNITFYYNKDVIGYSFSKNLGSNSTKQRLEQKPPIRVAQYSGCSPLRMRHHAKNILAGIANSSDIIH